MRAIGAFLSTLVLVAAAMASPTKAEIGPCQPDKDGGLTCGSGPGAARVVEGTMSPSKRLAFAWRAPGSSPSDDPDLDKVENLLIRISDGAVLWSARGRFFQTAISRSNHIDEGAIWSPNSRFAVGVTDSKWSTDELRFFSIAEGEKVLVLDLHAIIEPAVRKQLRGLVKNESAYTFSVTWSDTAPQGLAVENRGQVTVPVLMQVPKQDRDVTFGITLKVGEKGGVLAARDVSVRRSRAKD
jgi:hypothetical protein